MLLWWLWIRKPGTLTFMGRPKSEKPKSERLGFRADQQEAARIHALVKTIQNDPHFQGVDVNITVVLKMLVRRALPLAELEYMGGSHFAEEEIWDYQILLEQEVKRLFRLFCAEADTTAERQLELIESLREMVTPFSGILSTHPAAKLEPSPEASEQQVAEAEAKVREKRKKKTSDT